MSSSRSSRSRMKSGILTCCAPSSSAAAACTMSSGLLPAAALFAALSALVKCARSWSLRSMVSESDMRRVPGRKDAQPRLGGARASIFHGARARACARPGSGEAEACGGGAGGVALAARVAAAVAVADTEPALAALGHGKGALHHRGGGQVGAAGGVGELVHDVLSGEVCFGVLVE